MFFEEDPAMEEVIYECQANILIRRNKYLLTSLQNSTLLHITIILNLIITNLQNFSYILSSSKFYYKKNILTFLTKVYLNTKVIEGDKKYFLFSKLSDFTKTLNKSYKTLFK